MTLKPLLAARTLAQISCICTCISKYSPRQLALSSKVKLWFGVCIIMSTPSPQEIIHAYRQLYRGLLHAVQFSKPARYVARDQLRRAFRMEDPSSFNQEKIDRTVKFLGYAAKEAGLEHRIVRNLLHTAYWEQKKYIFEKQVVHGKGVIKCTC
jgi:hypothetical protein